MTTVIEAIRQWDDQHPDGFMIAADHKFSCACPYCVTFLVTTGLEAGVQPDDPDAAPVLDPRWVVLRDEEAPDGKPTDEQVARIMVIADETL